jgi:Uma2 family endonuclease
MTTMTSLYTRSDYALLPEGFPAELVEGHLLKEATPVYGHQQLVLRVYDALKDLVPEGCVLVSPLGVPIDELNVFQPDLAVFGERPPDDESDSLVPRLVVEVLSASTRSRDRGIKRRRYLAAGVAEVWLVDREFEAVEVHDLDRALQRATGPARATSRVVPGFELVPAALFA